jgi:hypothetical protein
MRHVQRWPSLGAAEGSPTRALLAHVCVTLSLLAACSVDDRSLVPIDAVGGLSSQGGWAGTGDSGAAGEAPLPLCRYSGSTVDAGCETLVTNPGFSSNLAGWVAEDVGVLESWQEEDADKAPDSGSLAVINSNYSDEPAARSGTAGGGARQCIALIRGSQVDLAADVFIPKGQGAGFMGNTYAAVATLSLFFYTATGCQGQNASNFTSEPVQSQDEWVHVQASAQPPRGARSMAVRLATLKPFPQFSFQAQFDNVFVTER